MAALAQVASPFEETVTSVVKPTVAPAVHATQFAGIGTSVAGDALQWPVAVNCTDEPFAVAVAGLMLSDSSSRLPVPHPAISSTAAASGHTS